MFSLTNLQYLGISGSLFSASGDCHHSHTHTNLPVLRPQNTPRLDPPIFFLFSFSDHQFLLNLRVGISNLLQFLVCCISQSCLIIAFSLPDFFLAQFRFQPFGTRRPNPILITGRVINHSNKQPDPSFFIQSVLIGYLDGFGFLLLGPDKYPFHCLFSAPSK